MIHDAHTHFLSYTFFEKLGREAGLDVAQAGERLGWEMPTPDPVALGRRWVQEMDRHGVQRSVLFGSLPGEEEAVAAAVRAFPDRLSGFSMVNPVEGDPAAAARKIASMKLDGILLFPALHGYQPGDPRLYPLYEVAHEHKLFLFVHCGVLKIAFRTRLGLPSPFAGELANPLALQKPAALYPEARFILPHFGSGLLRELLMLADCCANVYTDTSGVGGWARYDPGLTPARVVRQAVQVMGAERILFGSDSSFFPRGYRTDVVEQQKAAFAEAGLSAEQQAQIMGGNLHRLLQERACINC